MLFSRKPAIPSGGGEPPGDASPSSPPAPSATGATWRRSGRAGHSGVRAESITVAALILLLGALGTGAATGQATAAAKGSDAVTAGKGASDAAKPMAPLSWAACPASVFPPVLPEPDRPKNLECATLTVPLDYAKPRGKTIRLALIRVRATDPARRLGSLVFNFGGPGGSGVDTFAGGGAALFKDLGTRYDLVTFDPRGVGRSSPVTCADDKQKDAWTAADGSPDNAAERAAFLSTERELTRGCVRRSGEILPHVGTANATRDLDRLRAALGDGKLNYVGFSYGTWLGGNYAHQFTGRVGRMVLDAAVDTKVEPVRFALQQTQGFQRALENFSEWAVQQPQEKGRTKKQLLDEIATLLKNLDDEPLRTDGDRALTQTHAELGIAAALYAREAWPTLLEGIQQTRKKDGTILLTLADILMQRQPDGHYSNFLDAARAIYCGDATRRITVRDIEKALPAFTKASPVFGASRTWSLANCVEWPVVDDGGAGRRVDAPGAPPIVVIGTTNDPATPYAWAPTLAKRLGSGVLLTLKGEGHGAYPTGDACIHSAVDGYLLDGRVPADGTTCP